MQVERDPVGQRDRLRFERRVRTPLDERGDGGVIEAGVARSIEDRTVFEQRLEHLARKVQAVKGRVGSLEFGDDAKGLGVVLEAAHLGQQRVEGGLAGVAERRMAQIVSQRSRLGQGRIDAKRIGQSAGQVSDFERVGQPGAEVIALVIDEYLRFILQTSESRGVHDALTVDHERRDCRCVGIGVHATLRLFVDQRVRRHRG